MSSTPVAMQVGPAHHLAPVGISTVPRASSRRRALLLNACHQTQGRLVACGPLVFSRRMTSP